MNRVIAGVHFPIDLAAGLVLGLTVGHYFIALAQSAPQQAEVVRLRLLVISADGTVGRNFTVVQYANQPIVGWKFESGGYGKAEFPWPEMLRTIVSGKQSARADFLTSLVEPVDAPSKTVDQRKRSPLCWLWDEAVKEWQ